MCHGRPVSPWSRSNTAPAAGTSGRPGDGSLPGWARRAILLRSGCRVSNGLPDVVSPTIPTYLTNSNSKEFSMSTSTNERSRSGLAAGFIVFAGVAMVMIGALHALQGLVALFNDDFYVVGQKWIFEFDLTTWGWIHLIGGLLVLVAGFFVFNGAVWARVVGIAAAALSAVLNFMWLPYYPVWGLIIIALDVMVIWALSVHGREFAR